MWVNSRARGRASPSASSSVARQEAGPGSIRTSSTFQHPMTRSRPRCRRSITRNSCGRTTAAIPLSFTSVGSSSGVSGTLTGPAMNGGGATASAGSSTASAGSAPTRGCSAVSGPTPTGGSAMASSPPSTPGSTAASISSGISASVSSGAAAGNRVAAAPARSSSSSDSLRTSPTILSRSAQMRSTSESSSCTRR